MCGKKKKKRIKTFLQLLLFSLLCSEGIKLYMEGSSKSCCVSKNCSSGEISSRILLLSNHRLSTTTIIIYSYFIFLPIIIFIQKKEKEREKKNIKYLFLINKKNLAKLFCMAEIRITPTKWHRELSPPHQTGFESILVN